MQNSELWRSYDYYTSELTKHARQLAFAGVAVCWLLRSPEGRFSTSLVLALVLFVGFFILDLLQFYVAGIVHKFWIQRQEARMQDTTGSIEGVYDKPRWLDRPAFVFFHLKVISLVGGFLSLGLELSQYSSPRASLF